MPNPGEKGRMKEDGEKGRVKEDDEKGRVRHLSIRARAEHLLFPYLLFCSLALLLFFAFYQRVKSKICLQLLLSKNEAQNLLIIALCQ